MGAKSGRSVVSEGSIVKESFGSKAWGGCGGGLSGSEPRPQGRGLCLLAVCYGVYWKRNFRKALRCTAFWMSPSLAAQLPLMQVSPVPEKRKM